MLRELNEFSFQQFAFCSAVFLPSSMRACLSMANRIISPLAFSEHSLCNIYFDEALRKTPIEFKCRGCQTERLIEKDLSQWKRATLSNESDEWNGKCFDVGEFIESRSTLESSLDWRFNKHEESFVN